MRQSFTSDNESLHNGENEETKQELEGRGIIGFKAHACVSPSLT